MSSSLAPRCGATMLRMRADERGVTALEYALIGVLIAVVIVVAVASVGTTLSSAFVKFSSII